MLTCWGLFSNIFLSHFKEKISPKTVLNMHSYCSPTVLRRMSDWDELRGRGFCKSSILSFLHIRCLLFTMKYNQKIILQQKSCKWICVMFPLCRSAVLPPTEDTQVSEDHTSSFILHIMYIQKVFTVTCSDLLY